MINSSPLNSTPLNAFGDPAILANVVEDFTVGDILTDETSVNVLENLLAIGTFTGIDSLLVFDYITVDDTLVSEVFLNIAENLALDGTMSSSASMSLALADSIVLRDTLRVAIDAALAENVTGNDTLAGLISAYTSISEAVAASDPLLSRADHSMIVASGVTIASLILLDVFVEVLAENMEVSDTVLNIFNAATSIAELLSVADVTTNNMTLSVIYADDVTAGDALTTTADLSSLLTEDMIFIITMNDGTKTYQAMSLNPETFSVSEYDNYSFNSTTNFQGNHLLAGATGLYSMGGTTDDGAYITAKIKTASMDFGTSSLKQCPKMYLGINNDASLVLRVSVDGQYTSSYQLDISSANLSTQIFDIGKGLKGRYWQFELQSKSNSTLNLDEMEFFPVQWGRKH